MRSSAPAILSLSLMLVLRSSALGASPILTKEDAKEAVDQLHERYLQDYTSSGNKKILDWQKSVVSMMFVHAHEVLGEPKYLEWAREALYVEYNLSDDQCWGANAVLELNLHQIQMTAKKHKDPTGKEIEVTDSYQDIFDHALTTSPQSAPPFFYGYYDDPKAHGRGGIFWNRDHNSYNTCTLAQASILAFRMPDKEINGKHPREIASTWLDLQCDLLIEKDTGFVFDNYKLGSEKRYRGRYSYNNGTVLAALGLASKKAKERHPGINEVSGKVMNFVMTDMAADGVLYSPSADFGNSNAHAFNGVFMHFAPLFFFSDVPEDAKKQMEILVDRSASAIRRQMSTNRAPISYSWSKPFNQEEANCMTTVSGLECLLTYLQIKNKILPIDYR
jgi:hypothetical protein